MIELQRLTGMRPGEVVIMRSMDLDVTGEIWEYTPNRHKTEHHGRERRIPIGPRGQTILREWLRPDLTAYLFSPAEAEAERLADLRRTRKTPVQPSQRDRRKPGRRRKLADHYKVCAYHHAILHGCRRAFPHPVISTVKQKERSPEQWAELKTWEREHAWHPNQLRHNAATRFRKAFGLDVARVILGHSSAAVTEIYAEVDREKALRSMEQVG
jgi:integrase